MQRGIYCFANRYRPMILPHAFLCAVALMIFTGPALAQEPENEPQETQQSPSSLNIGLIFQGTVSAIQGTWVQILEGKITLDATGATVTSTDGVPLQLSNIPAGTRITAFIPLDPGNASSPIRTVSIYADLHSNGSLGGILQQVDLANRTITIYGQPVLITDKTIFLSPIGSRKPTRLEELKVGKLVTLTVEVVGMGLVATTVAQTKAPK